MNIGTLRGFLELEDNFTPKLERAGKLVSQSGDKWTKAGSSMQSAGAKMTLGITAPIVAAGGAAIKFATDFNAGMANVATLIPGNSERILELKDNVQEMAVATGKSTADLTDGLYQTVSAFGDSAESAKLLEINARAAAAGVATTTDAINLTSAVTKGYGDTSAAAVSKVADLAFQAVKLGQTTFPELAGSIGRVTPLAAELGVTQEELFGTMATFTGVTGNAAEVSTQLRGVFQGLISPTDTMKELFGELGVESGAALIEQRGLAGAMETVIAAANAGGGDLADYLGSIEGQTLALAATGSQADVYAEKLDAMTMATGAADEAFREQTEGINAAGFQWDQFQQRLTVVGQKLGDVLIPIMSRLLTAVEPVLDWAIGAVDWFGKLPAPVQTVGVAIAGIAAAAGPVLLVLGTLISSFGAVAGVVGPLITSLGGAGLAGSIGSVALGILGPAGLVVAVGAASVAMGGWINENIIGTQALADFGVWLGIGEEAVTLTAAELETMKNRQTEATAATNEGAAAVAAATAPTFDLGIAAAETASNVSLLPPGFGDAKTKGDEFAGTATELERAMWALSNSARANVEAFEDLSKVEIDWPAISPPASAPELIDTLDRAMERYGVTIPNTARELKEVTMLLESGQVPAAQMTRIVDGLRDKYERLGVLTPELNAELRELERAAGSANNPLGSLFGSFETGIGFIDDAIGGLGSFVTDGLGGLVSGIAGLFGGGGDGGGGILGSIFGGIGSLFGGGGTKAGEGFLSGLGGILGGGGKSGGIGGLFSGILGGGEGGGLGGMLSGLFGGGAGGLASTASSGFLGGLSGILGSVSSFIPIVGPLLSAFGGPLLKGIKALGGKIWGGIKSLFGGPSGDELDARDIVGSVNDAMVGLLDSQQKLEAGGERWKLQNVAQRDIIMALGGSVSDVEATWQKFTDAQKSTEGAAAFEAFFSEKMERVKAAMSSTGLGLTDLRDLAINSAKIMGIEVSDAFEKIAAGTITSTKDAHAAAKAAMDATAADAAGSVAEVQETATKAVEDTVDATTGAVKQAAENAKAATLEATRAIEEQAGVAKAAAAELANTSISIKVGFDVEDLDLGDFGEVEGRRRGEEEEGFASGTGFDFLNFKKATRTTLHGSEAVVTKSQGRDLASMVSSAARAGASGGGMGGGGPMTVQVMLPNGKILTEAVIENMPRMLAQRGVGRGN